MSQTAPFPQIRSNAVLPLAVPVSVLIPVKNEEKNLAACLQSVSWADECTVVDSGSTDRTKEISAEYGAKLVPFSWQPGNLKKKNWALQNCKFGNDWVLILDADERITESLAGEIADVIKSHKFNGYYLNRRFFFLGKWIRHAGYFPSWNLRLFRRGFARYEFMPDYSSRTGDNEVHEHMILEGEAGKLEAPMDHYAYPDVFTFLEKHNRYSNWEATCNQSTQDFADSSRSGFVITVKRLAKRAARKIPFPHWARFIYHYAIRAGFLDGLAGYFFCHLLAEYEFQIWVKRYEISKAGGAAKA